MKTKLLILLSLSLFLTTAFSLDHYSISLSNKTDLNASFSSALCTISNNNSKLHIKSPASDQWPGITFKPLQGVWNIEASRFIKADISNTSSREIQLFLRVDSQKQKQTTNIKIAPKTTATITLDLAGSPWVMNESLKLDGLFSHPDKTQLNLTAISSLNFFLNKPRLPATFTINNIRISGKTTRLNTQNFFPFIDRYGQFIHDNWPGKVHSNTDLKKAIQQEEQALKSKPAPSEWNKYGGWAKGPQLVASGRFRVEKHQGKWSLVDPLGRIFWSNGITCVSTQNTTAITHREKYFKDLPLKKTTLSQFYQKHWWANKGFYQSKIPFTTYNFLTSNLLIKYGPNWQSIYNNKAHRRLRSWGINTMGNWSSEEIFLQQKTVYTATAQINTTAISASSGYWKKFHDVFSRDFRKDVKKALTRHQYSLNDPWCLGVFVDNELSWGEDVTLAKATLRSPSQQAAKQEFIKDLKLKYKTIDQLNKAWGSRYKSWQYLLDSQEEPPLKAKFDLVMFTQKIADTYYRTIKEELDSLSPETLFLGSRFAEVNDYAATAAAKFCDIVSYNKYVPSVSSHFLPRGIDRPIIIGEFHFGAQDRGIFNTGLQSAANQKDRARLYRQYILGAATNPQIVGAHWFQYCDQPTTGRVDGENYQIGFISITDTPYPEIISASQRTAEELYRRRYKVK